jgi:stress-induced-phosphoprotein 1
LQAGKTSEAIEHYTKAINIDGANHVYFSNRSAAYLSQGDANNALEDAIACIGLAGYTFAKGYSRKGAALHALKRYNDSIAAYEEGLVKFPNDASLKKGLEDVKREKDPPPFTTPAGGMFGGDFGGGLARMLGGGNFSPEKLAQLKLDPKMQPYFNDAELMAKVKIVQADPNRVEDFMRDSKFMAFFIKTLGAGLDEDDMDVEVPDKPTSSTVDNKDTMQVDESPIMSENQRAARARKDAGNLLFQDKKFDEALAAYEEAVALDPTNMTFLNNKAAVYFMQKKYDECIETCLAAVDVGKAHQASFEDRAKAYTRAAKAYQKKGDLESAIEYCNKAQLESFDKTTQRLLKQMELDKKKRDKLAYQDDEKAEAAKQRGNDLFRDQKYGEAVHQYEEAVKRAPKNAAIRNNLAAALSKVMDFAGAQRHIEEALEIDPKYVKAWARKGDIEIYMKEFHKAQESYKKGLEIDPENKACREGLQKCAQQISYGRRNMTDEEKKEQYAHAMADPEIQSIISDPVIQQILREFNENPTAAQQAMANPGVRQKIQKLIAAGIIETA